MSDHPHTEVFRKWNGKSDCECNVEYRMLNSDHWLHCNHPQWHITRQYRIKPEKKLVPFTFEEWLEHKGRWLRRATDDFDRCILVCSISTYGDGTVIVVHQTSKHLCENYVFDDDGSPCGKYVEEES